MINWLKIRFPDAKLYSTPAQSLREKNQGDSAHENKQKMDFITIFLSDFCCNLSAWDAVQLQNIT